MPSPVSNVKAKVRAAAVVRHASIMSQWLEDVPMLEVAVAALAAVDAIATIVGDRGQYHGFCSVSSCANCSSSSPDRSSPKS